MERLEHAWEPTPIDPDGLFAFEQKPCIMNGVQHFPACRIDTGRVQQADGGELVQFSMMVESMLGNPIGIFLRMTPEGARTLAGQLIAEAQKVDNTVALQAAAVIELARIKGGTPDVAE